MNQSLLQITVIVCSGAIAASCATPSKEIEASYVSPIIYQNYTCEQLSVEATMLSQRAQSVMAKQDKRAKSDAVATGVALILFWPAMFLVKGNGTDDSEIAQLKGQMDTVENVSNQKQCLISFVDNQNGKMPADEVKPTPIN